MERSRKRTTWLVALARLWRHREAFLKPPEPRGLAFRRCGSPWPSAWPRCEYAASCLIYAGIISARMWVAANHESARIDGKMGVWKPERAGIDGKMGVWKPRIDGKMGVWKPPRRGHDESGPQIVTCEAPNRGNVSADHRRVIDLPTLTRTAFP
jgi:hypothetical protein